MRSPPSLRSCASRSSTSGRRQWLDLMAVVEPHLIAELAILYAIAPWLARQA